WRSTTPTRARFSRSTARASRRPRRAEAGAWSGGAQRGRPADRLASDEPHAHLAAADAQEVRGVVGQRERAPDQLGGLCVGHRRAALLEQELDGVAGGALLRNRARDRPDA